MAAACAGDLGNYEYTELEGPQVSGISESYEVLTFGTLSVSPVIEGGLPEDGYTYEWKVIDRNNDNAETVLATTRDLDYRVALSPGAYSMYYTLTEKETGIFWRTSASLTVNSSLSEGWMVLCSDKEGAARLDFVSEVTEEIYTDLLSLTLSLF